MPTKHLNAFPALLLVLSIGTAPLTGCSTATPIANDTAVEIGQQPADPAIAEEPEPVYRRFSEETLYSLLVAEFAARRGALDVTLRNYLRQAATTRDPGVAAQATRIARFLNADAAALEAAQLWVQLEPQSEEALFTVATELAKAGRPGEAIPHMLRLRALNASTNFAAVAASALDLPESDRRQMLTELLALEGNQDADLLTAKALLMQSLGDNEGALEAAGTILELDPENQHAAMIEAQVYQNQGLAEKAYQRLEQALAANPHDRRMRAQYARMLAKNDLKRAEIQFRILSEQNPEDAEARLSLALLYREMKNFPRLREELKVLIEQNRYASAAHFYLAQDAEREGDFKSAISHYLEVGPSSMFLAALSRAGELIFDASGSAALGETMRQVREQRPEIGLQLSLLETEIRSDRNDLDGARALLDHALEEHPGDANLLYARSMVCEKQGDIAGLEHDLREILNSDPDSALALNALGYSLTNLSDRHAEALPMIQRALELKPDDPAILDSMGWVYYRLGRHEEAIAYLRRAFALFPDHEVAAHLGEVLWESGAHDEAREIWDKGLKARPDSPLILESMRRLGVEPAQAPAAP